MQEYRTFVEQLKEHKNEQDAKVDKVKQDIYAKYRNVLQNN